MAVFEVRVAVGDAPSRTLRVQASALVLGRSRDCHVRLPSAAVSGAHLRIVARGAALWVEDLGSANGTRLAARKLVPGHPEPLTADQCLEVGPYQVWACVGDRGDTLSPGESERVGSTEGAGSGAPLDRQAPGGPESVAQELGGQDPGTATLALGLVRDLLSVEAAPPAVLRVLPPSGQERLFHLSVGQRARIGRDPSCALSVNDPDLSREHAEVWLHEAGVSVRDLGSKNGVLRGTEPIHGATSWRDGEALRLGGTTLWLQDPAEAWLRELDGEAALGAAPREAPGEDPDETSGVAAPSVAAPGAAAPGEAVSFREEERAPTDGGGEALGGEALGGEALGGEALGGEALGGEALAASGPAMAPAISGEEPAGPISSTERRRRVDAGVGGLGVPLAIGFALLVMVAAAWGLVRLLE